mmetsp:Transcript_35531/g.110290  ORF Transcript_35531/g.110290 Transcript_35531/m.110290 type:complete len:104 (-) Transcript_35531:74-385(-)
MASAVNLAISYGTMATGVSRLNPHLRNVYVPFGAGANFTPDAAGQAFRVFLWNARSEDGMPFTQHLYGFPGFRCPPSREERRRAILEYEEREVVVRTVPGTEP